MADLAAVTRVEITATDSTGAAINSAIQRLGQVSAAGETVRRTFVQVAAALGVSLSVAGIVEFAKGVVGAAEDLRTLSRVTGSSVEDLSQLANAARVAGVSGDYFRVMLERMASNMETLDQSSTKAQRALAFLGVTAKDPAEALRQTAVALDQYADSASKAAAMRDIFGRGGADMAAALHSIATASKDLVTTTTEDAEAAAKLGEQVRLLQVHMTGLKDILLRDIVPSLNTWIYGVQAARAAGLGWFESLQVGTTFIDRIGPSLNDARKEMEELQARLAGFERYGFTTWAEQAVKDIDSVAARITALKNIQLFVAQSMISPANMDARDRALENANKKTLDYKSANEEAAKATEAFVRSLVDEYARLTMTAEAFQMWQARLKGLGDSMDALIRKNAETARQNKETEDLIKSSTADYQALGKSIEDAANKRAEYVVAVQQETAALDIQLDALLTGKTAIDQQIDAVNRAIIAHAGDASAVAALTDKLEKLNEVALATRFDESAKAIDQQMQYAARSAQHLTDDIASEFARIWDDSVFGGGKNAFEELARYARRLFAQLVLEPLLRPVAGQVAGLLGFAAGGAGGAGSAFGSGLGSLGNLFPGGGLGGLYGSFATSGLGQGLGLSAPFFGVEAAGEIGMTAAGNAIGMAIPYLGPIAAAGTLLYSFLSANKEPSKVRGQLGISAGTTGFEDSAYTTSKYFGNVGFIDSETQQFSGAAAQAFNKLIVAALDELGNKMTAAQRVTTAGALQGTTFPGMEGEYTTEDFLKKYGSQVLKQVVDIALGQLDPALVGMVDAFKGADEELPAFVQSILDFRDAVQGLPSDIESQLVAAADGTQEMLDKLTAFAKLYRSVQDVMNANPLDDAALLNASQTMLGQIDAQAKALLKLAQTYDGTVAASQALQSATVGYYNTLVQALAQVAQMKTSVQDMFEATARSFNLQTMNKQQQYEFYRTEAASLERELSTATDPQRIQVIANKINDDLTAAWGLLTPEMQQNSLADYLASVDKINAETQARLDAASTQIQDNAATLLTQLRDLLNEAAEKFDTAAGKQLDAANTPSQININVTTDPGVSAEVDTGP